MRKIIVYIAISADGYIARKDGSVDWLDRPRTAGDYGMSAFFKTIDTILFGRKTWQVGQEMAAADEEAARAIESAHKGVKSYVFTTHPHLSKTSGAEFVDEPVSKFAKRLRRRQGKDIWMMGGGGIIASFLDANEIDEFIIHVIPVFIGEGIPLIAPRHRTVPLKLRSVKSFSDGVVRLHYEVLRVASPKTKRKRARTDRKPRPR